MFCSNPTPAHQVTPRPRPAPRAQATNVRIRKSDVQWLLPSHGPVFRKDDDQLDATIARLQGYLTMADFGTCATSWPLMDQWEQELIDGKMPE